MATLVITNPDGSTFDHDVGDQVTIGRADGNDLVLVEGGVSRKHARFFLEDTELMVEDLGSANGTWIDGAKIEGPTQVTTKSQVVIGDYELKLKPGRPAARPSRPAKPLRGNALTTQPKGQRSTKVVEALKPSSGKPALAKRAAPQKASAPQLRGLSGPIAGKTFPVAGKVVVGRVASVDLQIDDDSVSRRHAELVVEGKTVRLRDLGSANGTTLNGVPLSAEAELTQGDIVQFGVVEAIFETAGSASIRAAPLRRATDAPLSRRARDEEEGPSDTLEPSDEPMPPQRKRLVIIGGAVFAFLLLLVVVKAGMGSSSTDKPKPPPQLKKVKDPEQELEDLLAECRTYSSSEQTQPDWGRAETACKKALELEPIHAEANSLLQRITVLKKCDDHILEAKGFSAGGRLEDALDAYAKVGKDCEGYLLRTLDEAKSTIAEVKKAAGNDCKQYSAAAKWDLAYRRCEVYSRLACQTMEPQELRPPAFLKMKLDGPLNPKTDWRPSDVLYINFLKAREKLKPGEPPWVCPDIPAFRPPPPPQDPGRLAKAELAKRYADPEMGGALVAYFEGKFQAATVPLQKIIENMNKSAEHEAARALLVEINNAVNLYANGTAEITNDRPERAAIVFRTALQADERLVLGEQASKMSEQERRRELGRRVSFVRANIVESMVKSTWGKGQQIAQRQNYRDACRTWKLGQEFSRGSTDLSKSLSFCTSKAKEIFDSAETCEKLQSATEFAVDGDGYLDKINQKLAESGCN